MKILVMTRSAWDDSNSTGNTMSNLFSGANIEDIANIYVRDARPNNQVCKLYYSISDSDVTKSIFKRKYEAGHSFIIENDELAINEYRERNQKNEDKIYNYFRKKSSILALWGQDLLWRMGNWKNKKLDSFLSEFSPDVIFSPCFHTNYTHRLLWYVQKKTNAKVVLFHADDYLSINKENSSSLEVINQKIRSKVVINSALKANINYCISHKQQEEYQEKIGKDMKLLYKGADFEIFPKYNLPVENQPIRIIYIGSILYGRWKTLALLANIIKDINSSQKTYELIIYSQYKPTKEMKEKMIIQGASKFMGKISAEQVLSTYRTADIALHIESFDKIEKQKTRLSFSTKIVDCLNSGRAVMAIGWKESASIDYLLKNDAALVATKESDIKSILLKIKNNRTDLNVYAQKAWECGKTNHQISEIQKSLYRDFEKIL